MSIVYLTHGGGPLPLLGDPGHRSLTEFLQAVPVKLGHPDAILIISAHWEEEVPTLTAGTHPGLIYDYGGFPPESYEIKYPAPGDPGLAVEIKQLLHACGISAELDEERGFDHGMFVPLKLMYPQADIPCVQLSLVESLDAAEHLTLGRALASLRNRNLLIVGSGSSFHNMRAMLAPGSDDGSKGVAFNKWLIETCTTPELDPEARETRLVHWEDAPHARFCHPREEHLLPLHVCMGAAGGADAEVIYNDLLFGQAMSALLWK